MNKKNAAIFIMALIIFGFGGWFGFSWISNHYMNEGAGIIVSQIIQMTQTQGYVQLGNVTLVPYTA